MRWMRRLTVITLILLTAAVIIALVGMGAAFALDEQILASGVVMLLVLMIAVMIGAIRQDRPETTYW